jgi:16S rRNA (cytosine967-C5)-methyltransferase
VTARQAAAKALRVYRRSGVYPADALAKFSETADARDVALASRLVAGVLQNAALCDYVIAKYSSIPPTKLEPLVLDTLRLSVYTLLFLTRIPAHAAVDEGVELIKNVNQKAAPLVNAVLRRVAEQVARSNGEPVKVELDDERERLSVQYSHPRELVDAFCRRFGIRDTELLLRADNDIAPVTLRVNTLLSDAETALAELIADGVEVTPHPWMPGFIDMAGGNVERLRAFQDGHVFAQDAGAYLAVRAAGVQAGQTVIDGCAAPGGKSFSAAIDMENRGRILSCDLPKKAETIADGAKRLGIRIIQAVPTDSREFNAEYESLADVVLVDAPCSGFGVIRKKPEIRYKSDAETAPLPEKQLALLGNLSRYCKVGGTLLYSTCTLAERENEDVAREFLARHAEFEAEEFILPNVGKQSRGVPSRGGMVTLLPHEHGTDGFFICKMRRKA